jgi:hypothetical protein
LEPIREDSEMAEEASLVGPLLVALVAAVIGPWVLEYWKWKNEPKRRLFHEREVRYYNFLTNFSGFLEPRNPQKIDNFLEHYYVGWMYLPDEIIEKVNLFLDATQTGQVVSNEEKEKRARAMVMAIRRAFHGKTNLRPEDFKFFVPT